MKQTTEIGSVGAYEHSGIALECRETGDSGKEIGDQLYSYLHSAFFSGCRDTQRRVRSWLIHGLSLSPPQAADAGRRKVGAK